METYDIFKEVIGMKLVLIDYADNKVEFEIGDIEQIGRIDIDVITGDEIATVTYKDYTVRKFVSEHAFINYHDLSYSIYAPNEGIDLIHDDKWLHRKNSYDV